MSERLFTELELKAKQRITEQFFRNLVDDLNQIYGYIRKVERRGTAEDPWAEFYGYYGYFLSDLFVQGRRVIKDGDPIYISDFQPEAESDLEKAVKSGVDTSTKISNIETYAKDVRDKVASINVDEYGNVGTAVKKPITLGDLEPTAVTKIKESIDTSQRLQSIETDVKVIKDKTTKVRIDEYGNVGVIISETVTQYETSETKQTNAFEPVTNRIEVNAYQNTYGVELVVNKGGRPFINIFYKLGGSGTIYVEVSIDGEKWRLLDTIPLDTAGEGIKIYQGISYPWVRVRTPTTGIDVEFEITASR